MEVRLPQARADVEVGPVPVDLAAELLAPVQEREATGEGLAAPSAGAPPAAPAVRKASTRASPGWSKRAAGSASARSR